MELFKKYVQEHQWSAFCADLKYYLHQSMIGDLHSDDMVFETVLEACSYVFSAPKSCILNKNENHENAALARIAFTFYCSKVLKPKSISKRLGVDASLVTYRVKTHSSYFEVDKKYRERSETLSTALSSVYPNSKF